MMCYLPLNEIIISLNIKMKPIIKIYIISFSESLLLSKLQKTLIYHITFLIAENILHINLLQISTENF